MMMMMMILHYSAEARQATELKGQALDGLEAVWLTDRQTDRVGVGAIKSMGTVFVVLDSLPGREPA